MIMEIRFPSGCSSFAEGHFSQTACQRASHSQPASQANPVRRLCAVCEPGGHYYIWSILGGQTVTPERYDGGQDQSQERPFR